MFQRAINLPKRHSFFLFGARGTGKSTLVHQHFEKNTLFIDLLSAKDEEDYSRDPDLLLRQVKNLPDVKTIVIDEIQKVPKLLDVVHKLIFETHKQFVLTGSSARKLKQGAANLLAGRAFERALHPLTVEELKETFSLDCVLRWGSLPQIFSMDDADRKDYLLSYTRTYLKEEIWNEHIIRKLDPFRKFLEVAAQHNGKIINFSEISRDVGGDSKTIREYFQILEDTYLGFILEPYLKSTRKRVHKAPKFYFFDIGVCRALADLLEVVPLPQTSYFGEVFEHFFILELIRKESYLRRGYRFYYLSTESNEIDLIIERPGKKLAVIEIKSTDFLQEEKLSRFLATQDAFKNAEFFCVSRDQRSQKIKFIKAMHWTSALDEI